MPLISPPIPTQPDSEVAIETGTYQFSPLPRTNSRAFRLLYLLPGAPESLIQCLLAHSDLDDEKNKFEALSYVWGDPSDPPNIWVNGATFPVRKNLHAALLRLRNPEGDTRVLWIDAVCINQDDNDEKGIQVAMMGDIYRNTLSTVIWFGEATPHSAKVFTEMKKLADINLVADGKSLAELQDTYVEWECVFANAWWQRAWTLQEIVLSQSAVLVMGPETIDWLVFCEAMDRARLLEYFPRGIGAVATPGQTDAMDRLQAIMSRSLRPAIDGLTTGDQLLFYLACASRRKASEAIDKLYSVLALPGESRVQQDIGTALQPNYNAQLAEVYISATKALISSCGNLDALGFCHRGPPTAGAATLPLPSWVPSWGTTGESLEFATPLLQDAQGTRRAGHASRGAPLHPVWGDGGDITGHATTLTLHGQILDTIAALTETQPSWNSKAVPLPDSRFGFTAPKRDADYTAALQDFFAHARRYLAWVEFARACLRTNEPNKMTPDEATALLCETLTTGHGSIAGEAKMKEAFDLWLHCLSAMIRVLDETRSYRILPQGIIAKDEPNFQDLLPPDLRGVVKEDMDAVYLDTGKFAPYMGHTTNRRLGITKGGDDDDDVVVGGGFPCHLCLLPADSQPGDLLVILRGGRFPVILRPVADNDDDSINLVEFIGEAYVHGIMDGEAWDDGACVEFRIR